MHTLLNVIKKVINKHFMAINRYTLILLVSGYVVSSWVGLVFANEPHLTDNFASFIYYIVTTSSTVGYGDLSPITTHGQLLAALFIIPCGVGLFALSIGKIAVFFTDFWRANRRGKQNLNLENHIIVIGIHSSRTPHLLEMLKREEQGRREVVVVSCEYEESPFDSDVHFVRVNSFTDAIEMERASLSTASAVIVDTDLDDATLTVSLFIAEQNSDAHLVAHFDDSIKRDLLHKYCPNSECISSLSTELVAKSVIDKGSSFIHSELVSAHKGQTQYSIEVPENINDLTLESIYYDFKKHHEAIIIAVHQRDKVCEINPSLATILTAGDIVYYIADERIVDLTW
ncbi:potassium channel family protein [Photobacterium kishitanii]|uniref:potassium channel family protein n=1 Tax=Photobacterium kishitanii TaxID=318456 RepID=UPI000D161DE9|nr:potassium channel family protein [Photobacterium kishitanii]PSV18848.1 potassium channel related protein [Photobacterium kishitanii]